MVETTGSLKPGFMVTHPDGASADIPFNSERLVIGSATFADVRISQKSVNNIHAVVEVNADTGSAIIFDMGSTTGTFINGKKIVQQELKPGDEIKIGFTTLKYGMQSPDKTPTPVVVDSGLPASRPQMAGVTQQEYIIDEDGRAVKPIFKYPHPSKRALRVIMYWGETPFEIFHFVSKDAVTVGEDDKNDFVLPEFVAGKEFNLVEFRNGTRILKTSSGMTGTARLAGKMMNLEDAQKVSGSVEGGIPIQDGDMVKLKAGDIGFFLDYVPAPPTVKPNPLYTGDPDFIRVLGPSTVLFLLLLFLIVNFAPERQNEIPEILPERIATLIYKIEHPPKKRGYRPPPPKQKRIKQPQQVPKQRDIVKPNPPKTKKQIVRPKKIDRGAKVPKVAKLARKQGKEGEGARARGKVGMRGSPNSNVKGKPMYKAQRPSRSGLKRGLGNPGNSQAKGQGVADMLNKNLSKGLSKLFAGGGQGLSGASKNMRGYGDVTTRGGGGLAEVGTGKGGGGQSYGIGGLGTKGLGGGAKGTGTGAYGTDGEGIGGLVGSKGAVQVSLGVEEDIVIMGSLDPAIINRVLQRYINEIRFCYEEYIQSKKNIPSGVIPVRWTIASSGRVSNAAVVSRGLSLKAKPVQRCLVGVIKSIKFPEPKGGGVVDVTKSFSFRPSP